MKKRSSDFSGLVAPKRSEGGWILLDKPGGMSSRYAASRVARMFGAKTFGHLGTLDPMASGLLPIALGEATKMIPYLENVGANGIRPKTDKGVCHTPLQSIKEYLFAIRWGIETDTGDITGNIVGANNIRPQCVTNGNNIPVETPQGVPAFAGMTNSPLQRACAALVGEYDQVPPIYSAVHVNGRRAYELARAGRAVEIPPRRVTIYDLKYIDRELGVFPAPGIGGGIDSPDLHRQITGESWVGDISVDTPPTQDFVSAHTSAANKLYPAPQSGAGKASSVRQPDPGFAPANQRDAPRDDTFIVQCSPGTYVRSLVQDIAKRTQELMPYALCPMPLLATASMIRRTRTHGFDIKDAVSLDFLENLFNNDPTLARAHLRPLDFGLDDIPVTNIGAGDAARFQNGGWIEGIGHKAQGISNGLVRVYSDDVFIGIGAIEDNQLKPKRIINS